MQSARTLPQAFGPGKPHHAKLPTSSRGGASDWRGSLKDGRWQGCSCLATGPDLGELPSGRMPWAGVPWAGVLRVRSSVGRSAEGPGVGNREARASPSLRRSLELGP